MVGVRHAYGKTKVLNDISLTVPAGELVCLLGPSGCGKTTLLRIAAGLERLQAGSVTIDEQVVADTKVQLPPEDRQIGFMFQDYALFPHLTVFENVTFGLFRQDPATAKARAGEVLEQVGMTQHSDKHPHLLSGGQQQRVALARALAPKPRLVLLDEPFAGLDTNMRARVRQETLTVLKQTNVATLMVTHDHREAMFMADRIKVMGENGQILQSGRPEDIYYRPAEEYVARLFGPMNMIEGKVLAGSLATSFGALEVGAVSDGLGVRVLIRREGLILSTTNSQPGDTPVEVRSTHLLGDSSLVRFVVREGINAGEEFQARIPGAYDLAQGGPTWVRVDPAHVFPYPQT
jgi:iron(III) transport system ATP-binding protein